MAKNCYLSSFGSKQIFFLKLASQFIIGRHFVKEKDLTIGNFAQLLGLLVVKSLMEPSNTKVMVIPTTPILVRCP